MWTTITNTTTPDRGRADKQPGLLADLRATWRRWREHVWKAGGFSVATLALFAISGCDGASSTPVALAAACPPALGSISLAWALTNPSGQPVSCAVAGAQSVALRLRSRTGGTPVFTAFPCADTTGTATVPAGLYDVAIELHDASGAKLATVPEQTAVAVAAGRTKPLAPVTFTVSQGGGNPPGSVLLAIQAQGFTFNCRPNFSDGAGITGTTITLEKASGGCAPVTFVRHDGTTQIGTYKVDCSSPQVASCIEKFEGLTSPDLMPGAYVMHVRGKIGAVDCWAGDSTLVVPPPGQPPLQQLIFLQHQSLAGC